MTRPITSDELHRNLAQFSGTERYYRTHPDLLATDGVKYLEAISKTNSELHSC